MNLIAGRVRHSAEVGVAHDIEIGETGQAERLAKPAAFRGFKVKDQIGVVADGMGGAPCGIDGTDHGGFVFAPGDEAVLALVGGVEGQVALNDDVGLA